MALTELKDKDTEFSLTAAVRLSGRMRKTTRNQKVDRRKLLLLIIILVWPVYIYLLIVGPESFLCSPYTASFHVLSSLYTPLATYSFHIPSASFPHTLIAYSFHVSVSLHTIYHAI